MDPIVPVGDIVDDITKAGCLFIIAYGGSFICQPFCAHMVSLSLCCISTDDDQACYVITRFTMNIR